jgi:hypothetical protein
MGSGVVVPWRGESEERGCGWIKSFILKAASSTPTFPPKQNSFIPPIPCLPAPPSCLYRYASRGQLCARRSKLQNRINAGLGMPLAAGVGGGETSLSCVDVTGSQSTQEATRSWSLFQLSSNTRALLCLSTGPVGEGLSYKRPCYFVKLALLFSSLSFSVRDFSTDGRTDERKENKRPPTCPTGDTIRGGNSKPVHSSKANTLGCKT